MEIEKVHIRHCMLHYFHRGKSAAETSRIICKTYVNILWAFSSKHSITQWIISSLFNKQGWNDSLCYTVPLLENAQYLKVHANPDCKANFDVIIAVKIKNENFTRQRCPIVCEADKTACHTIVLRYLYALGKIHKKRR